MEPKELAHKLSMVGLESVVEPRYPEMIDGSWPAGSWGRKAPQRRPPDRLHRGDRLRRGGGGLRGAQCQGRDGHPPGPARAVLKGGFKLKKSKIRGVESFGMLCAEDELGLSADHSGIMDLGRVEPGTSLHEIIDFGDHILEVDVTPNRVDTASVIGIARETAALLGQELRLPGVDYPEKAPRPPGWPG